MLTAEAEGRQPGDEHTIRATLAPWQSVDQPVPVDADPARLDRAP